MRLAEYIAPGRHREITIPPATRYREMDHDDAEELRQLVRADEREHGAPVPASVPAGRQQLRIVDGWRVECVVCESAPSRCGCER